MPVSGTSKPSNESSTDSTPLYPSFLIGAPTSRPGCEARPGSFSTTNAVIPRCRGSASGSVTASSMIAPARRPFVAHIFWPVIA